MIFHRSHRSRRARGLRVAIPIASLAVAAAACGGGTGGSSGSQANGPATSPPPASSSSPTESSGAGSGGSGYGSGGGGSTTSSGAATVAVSKNADLGTILADSHGRTVYLFEKDSNGKSACSGACAQAWPPLTTSGKPQVSGTAKLTLLGTTHRTDGKTQVVYHGHPLYYYQGDSKTGQTNGEGLKQFGAEWYALSPAGDKVEHAGS